MESDVKNKIRALINRTKKNAICLFITVGVCVSLLVATSCIPTSFIAENAKESSVYFAREKLFKPIKMGQKTTTCDFYAECILVNMAYRLDRSHPFTSAIKAEYVQNEKENVNVTFKKCMFSAEENENADVRNYSRYWHGSLVLLKPLLMIGDIRVVKNILTVILCIIFALNLYILYQKQFKSAALYYVLGFLVVQGYVVFHGFSYIMNFLIVNVLLLLIESRWIQSEDGFLCLITTSGVITSFFDFLTTETITLTLPVVMYLLMREKGTEKQKGEQVNPIRIAGWSIVCWGIGYSFMFLLKWILVYLFLGKDEFVGSIQQVNMRIQEGNMWLALKNNIAAMFYHRNPENHPYAGIVSFVSILFLLGIIILAMCHY